MERLTMSRIICIPSRRVKLTRRTARHDRSFGAGLVHFVPIAVTAPGYVEPSDEDKAAAAAMFADDDDLDPAEMELRAAEAAYYDWCQGW
jgi:hypothetical protein